MLILQNKKNNLTAVHSGGAYETRTHDLFNAIEAL